MIGNQDFEWCSINDNLRNNGYRNRRKKEDIFKYIDDKWKVWDGAIDNAIVHIVISILRVSKGLKQTKFLE